MIVGRWYVQNVVHDTGICHDVSIILLNVLLFFAIPLFKLTNSGTEKLNGKATIPAYLILIRFCLFVCLLTMAISMGLTLPKWMFAVLCSHVFFFFFLL